MRLRNFRKITSVVAAAMIMVGSQAGVSSAIPKSVPYSYDFVSTVGQTKTIEVSFDYMVSSSTPDESKIEIDNGSIESASIENRKLKIKVGRIDPRISEYTITIHPGVVEFSDYVQITDFEVKFRPYDVTLGFGSLFMNGSPDDANTIFRQNSSDQVSLHVNGSYITGISAVTRIDEDMSGNNIADITVNAMEADSVKIFAGSEERRVDVKANDDAFIATFQGVEEGSDITVYAYDREGAFLEKKNSETQEKRNQFRQRRSKGLYSQKFHSGRIYRL